MRAHTASPCFTVADPAACRDFFVRHFGARVSFDCGCYVNLDCGSEAASLQFMQPQEGSPPAPEGYAGIMLNFEVDDVDAEHERLWNAGLSITMPLGDHPWGDRGFAAAGPLGLSLYVFSKREPAAEFKAFYAP